jgi:hypothetical protein
LLSLFSAWNTGAYAVVFQRFSEPIGITATVPKPPVDVRQAAKQCARTDVITDLPGGDEQVERSPFAIVPKPMAQQC